MAINLVDTIGDKNKTKYWTVSTYIAGKYCSVFVEGTLIQQYLTQLRRIVIEVFQGFI